ncbi:PIG-P-domain-containing protein [Decorospora gaudefroyi]|uniref:PIG-P-domain-containing protein n=1 Tax=Decorospora gaudefroyi TaxID=184978 RepID=A0A6A5KVI1_9PLEO|nr:PIG-P-domain-containing protein [Decorospora gaudefroyi]
MPSHSRGNSVPAGFYSKSTPNLPTLKSLEAHNRDEHLVASPPRCPARPGPSPLSPASNSALSGAASVEDNQEEDEALFTVEDPQSERSEEENEGLGPGSRPLHTSRSYSHLPRHTATALFPPFYNRPPTPLPPSPSLTSLLRPAFSRPTSRPTTPDSSDVEGPPRAGSHTNGTTTPTTNLANSARHAPTVPRASPKVPTYEYYGFALYLGSSAAFLMYILWAYVPAPMLHQMGIHYYPNRWWALAVPCWLVVLVVYIYVALASYNTQYLTLPLSSCENLVDECAHIAVVDRMTGQIVRDPVLLTDKLHEKDKEKGTRTRAPPSRKCSFSAYQFSASSELDWKSFWSTGTDAVMDVPIGGVCEILYGHGSDDC